MLIKLLIPRSFALITLTMASLSKILIPTSCWVPSNVTFAAPFFRSAVWCERKLLRSFWQFKVTELSSQHPACVRVKRHLSILPAVSQCQSRGGCWNLIVNRPLRRPLKQVKSFCFTAGRKLTLTTAAHHSHYHADDLNVFVLNELLLFSRLFWYFLAAFVATIQIFASQNPRFNPKDRDWFFPITLTVVADPLAFD